MLDEETTDSMSPAGRIDKQRVELHITVFSRDDRCKTRDHAIRISYPDIATFDLRDGNVDRVRMREQSVAIAWVVERGSALQILQRRTLRRNGEADPEAIQGVHWKSTTTGRHVFGSLFRLCLGLLISRRNGLTSNSMKSAPLVCSL